MKISTVVFAWLCSACLLMAADPIVLMGSNGREVPFAGVREASPQGLTLLMDEDGDDMLVTWDKFDLEALKKDHPKIYAAYENAAKGKTTSLRLGVYEDMMSQKQYLSELRKALAEEDSYKVPKLSHFFSHKDDDQTFTSTSKSQDSNAAKRSKRFVETYEELLTEFFQIKDLNLSKDTITWNWGNGDIYVIVKEAYPRNNSSVKLSHQQFIDFFANENHRSRNKAAEYLNANPEELTPVMGVLRKYRNIAKNKLLTDETTRHRYIYLFEKMEEHIEGLRASQTLPRSLERDFQDFNRELKLHAAAR